VYHYIYMLRVETNKAGSVKNKLYKGDGMSFSEFTYPLLQSWDWWHMYNTKGIQMQIGGSDQFGNIIAGIDAVKYIFHNHPHPDVRRGREEDFDTSHRPVGFTVPLLTTSSGEKFGKSAGNAIWLDKEQTSTFDLYGFFIRQSDADVGRYLRLFTFLPIEVIDRTMEEHMKAPEQRKAQHLLAREFVELVHGAEEAKDAELRHRMLFSKSGTAVPTALEDGKKPEPPAQITLNNAPKAHVKLPVSLIYNKSIGRIVYAAGLAESSSEGHRFISAGSIYIGGMPGQKAAMSDAALTFTPVKNWVKEDTAKFLVDGRLMILRKGKHNIRIVEVVTDEEWKESGIKYPGEELDELKDKQRQLMKESLAKRNTGFAS
jgi:tyrosyl-tRNA synthetase